MTSRRAPRAQLPFAALLLAACASAPPPSETRPASDEAAPAEQEAAPAEPQLSPRERAQQKLEAKRQAARDAPTVELPLKQTESSHIIVPVTIKRGDTRSFILDTGASMTVITPSTRDAMGLSPDEGMQVQSKGAGGDIGVVRLVELDSLAVGDRTYRELGAAVMELGEIGDKLGVEVAGILGANFLALHDLEIDFATGTLRLHGMGRFRREQPDRLSAMRGVPFERFEMAPLIKINVTIDDAAPMPAVFDLGAGRSIVNWPAAALAGLKEGAKRKTRGLKKSPEPALGADNKPVETWTYQFKRLALGDVVFDTPTLNVAPLPVFATLGLADTPAMIFGVDQLVGRALIIDYEDGRLYLSKTAG